MLAAEDLVHPGEQEAGSRFTGGLRPQRESRESADRGRGRPLADDIAHQDEPAILPDRGDVVEVAADEDPVPRRVESGRQLDAVDQRQRRRQERVLKRLRDRALAVVQLRALKGERALRGDRSDVDAVLGREGAASPERERDDARRRRAG